jgi:tetratricopeptide (TPR) repeat protein
MSEGFDLVSDTPTPDHLMQLFGLTPLTDEKAFFQTHWRGYELSPENQEAFDWVLQTHEGAQRAYQQGNLDAAIRMNEEALQVFPEFAESYVHLATIYQKAGAWDKCLEIVDRAYENVTEEVPWLHYYKGRALYERKQLHLALIEFLQEVTVSGVSEGVLRWLFQVFADQLDQKRSTNWRIDRRLVECAILCGFRILKIRFDPRLAGRMCGLWDDLERSGPWTEQILTQLTGMSRHDFNEFHRSFGSGRTVK